MEKREVPMRLASVLVLAVLLTGWQPGTTALNPATGSLIAQTRDEQVSPPPAQPFGPDTYRTGVFTGRWITRPGLTCDSTSTGGRVCNGFLRSAVDRALLDVTLM